MWTSQVYGHHDKMARTKTHRTSQTRSKQGRNRHKEITIFCVFRFFCFLFSIFNYWKDFSRKCWITALVRSMKIVGRLNQFSAAANLTLSQHFLEKKNKKIVHSFFSTRPLGNETKRQESNKIQNQNKEGLKKRKSLVQKVSCLLNSSQVYGRGHL